MDKNVWIKCQNCNEEGVVERMYWKQKDLEFSCTKCSQTIEVTYFGHCSNCNKKVGFYGESTRNILVNIGVSFVSGFIKPLSGIQSITRFFDDIPDASAWGYCPYCGHKFLKCPNCGLSNEVDINLDRNAIVICKECSKKMRHP